MNDNLIQFLIVVWMFAMIAWVSNLERRIKKLEKTNKP
jgi:hypothetical protein